MPYNTWPETSKVAYEVAFQMYFYDKNLADYLTSIDPYTEHYRTTKRFREQFAVRSITYHYKSLLYDTVGIWESDDSLIIGFRGTSTDPLRLLNYIPVDYHQRLLANLKSKGLKFSEFINLPYMKERDKSCDKLQFKKGKLDRNSIIAEVTGTYCTIGLTTPISSPTRANKKAEYTRDIDRIKSKVFEGLTGLKAGGQNELNGGYSHASSFSDCKADANIAFASSTNTLNQDPKHLFAAEFAKKIIDEYKNKKKIIFTGHSLGGSLAFYAFKQCLLDYQEKNTGHPERKNGYYFVGFNAATLKNIDMARVSQYDTLQTWKDRAIHYRNNTDIVSYLYGETDYYNPLGFQIFSPKNDFCPTIIYDDNDKGLHARRHDLRTFKLCKYPVLHEANFEK